MIKLDLRHFGRRYGFDRARCYVDHRNASSVPWASLTVQRLAMPFPRRVAGPSLLLKAPVGSAALVCWVPVNCANVCCSLSQAWIVVVVSTMTLPRMKEWPDAAKLGAEHLECPGSRRREPEIGDQARHHVHLGAELRHIEIVQDVDGAKQHLHRLADRQMQVGRLDHDVVLAVRVIRVETERVVGADVARVGRAERRPRPAGGSSIAIAGRRPRPRSRRRGP